MPGGANDLLSGLHDPVARLHLQKSPQVRGLDLLLIEGPDARRQTRPDGAGLLDARVPGHRHVGGQGRQVAGRLAATLAYAAHIVFDKRPRGDGGRQRDLCIRTGRQALRISSMARLCPRTCWLFSTTCGDSTWRQVTSLSGRVSLSGVS